MEWIEALQKAITYMEEHQEGSELINGDKGLFLEDIARVRCSYKKYLSVKIYKTKVDKM